MIANFLIGFAIFFILSQSGALIALIFARKKSRELLRKPLAIYPGVSIITSLKGPTPGAVESVRSLITQNYPGPLEVVFACLNEDEPLIADVKKVISEIDAKGELKCVVKWVLPVDTDGLNPRTAKIAKAYQASIHPWVLMVCVDTRFSKDYIRKAIEITELKPERYVTSFPVIDAPQTFAAKLEAVGLNVDVSQFFLLSSLSPKAACAYGGAFLYSRTLANKSGGYGPLVKLLTDDITLAQALRRAGGLCYLTDDLAYVRQEVHSFRNFWSRQIRWRMIGRFFLPNLYWLGPLSWAQFFLLVGGVALSDIRLLIMIPIVALARTLIGVGIQILLKTPRGDWRHAWVLPIYDWVAIPAFFIALLTNQVSWGPTLMTLNAKGEVSKSVVLK